MFTTYEYPVNYKDFKNNKGVLKPLNINYLIQKI